MNNHPIKIAFLSNQISWGGAPKSLLLLIKSISQQNFKFYLYVTHCSSDEMKKEFEQYVEFVKIIDLPEITSAQTQSLKHNRQKVRLHRFDSGNIRRFADELNLFEIDILHINNSVFSAIYETVRRRTNVKIVSHIREWIDWNGIHQKQKFIINNIDKLSDAIICISDTEAKVFNMNSNVNIISNPFDFNELHLLLEDNKQIPAELAFHENTFLVGMVGRSVTKGTLDFLRAFAYLRKKYTNEISNMKFIILGERIPSPSNILKVFLRKMLGKNTYSNDIYTFLKKENLLNKVTFLSKRKEVLGIINSFDVAVRPSYSGDPWGRDIIEYMALGKPIVATGFSEFFIKNGETGFLVPSRDYTLLAEKIYWLFKHENIRKVMGQKAFENIYSKCNTNIYKSQILHIYDTLFRDNTNA